MKSKIYEIKYLKYKMKYNNLKKKIDFNNNGGAMCGCCVSGNCLSQSGCYTCNCMKGCCFPKCK